MEHPNVEEQRVRRDERSIPKGLVDTDEQWLVDLLKQTGRPDLDVDPPTTPKGITDITINARSVETVFRFLQANIRMVETSIQSVENLSGKHDPADVTSLVPKLVEELDDLDTKLGVVSNLTHRSVAVWHSLARFALRDPAVTVSQA